MAVKSPSATLFGELFYLYLAIAILVAALVLGWLGYILVRFRAKPGQPRPRDAPKAGVLPAERGHPMWSYVMAILIAAIMFGLAFGTISAVQTLETPPEEGDRLNVTVTGFAFGWGLTYEGDGGIPLRENLRWRLPVDTAIVADVVSTDVWHNFALTEFRLRIDAVPGQTNHIWWKAEEPAVIRPVCVQLCGTGHAKMNATLTFLPKAEFEAFRVNWSQRAYAEMEKQGQVVNVTVDGSGFAPDTSMLKAPEKAHAFRVTSTASEPVTIEIAERDWILAPGETRMIYAPAAPQVGTKGGDHE